MDNIKNKNAFLISCVFCVLLLLTLCYFGVSDGFKGTSAAESKTVTQPCDWTAATCAGVFGAGYTGSCEKKVVDISSNTCLYTCTCTKSSSTNRVCSNFITESACYGGCYWDPIAKKCGNTPVSTITCNDGEYYNGTACYECPAGYYCKKGTYYTNNGAQGKKECPKGETSKPGSSDCYTEKTECTPGQYYKGMESVILV